MYNVKLFQQFHMPVKVIAPCLRDFPETNRDPDSRHPYWPDRLADKGHVGLTRCAHTFSPVAFHAGCHNILPCGPSTP